MQRFLLAHNFGMEFLFGLGVLIENAIAITRVHREMRLFAAALFVYKKGAFGFVPAYGVNPILHTSPEISGLFPCSRFRLSVYVAVECANSPAVVVQLKKYMLFNFFHNSLILGFCNIALFPPVGLEQRGHQSCRGKSRHFLISQRPKRRAT